MGWSLRAAQQDLADLSLDTIQERGGLREAAAAPLGAVARAHRWARSPLLTPLRPLPVVGEQVEGLREVTGRLDAVAASGSRGLERVEAELDATGEQGGRLRLVRTALGALDDLDADVRALPDLEDRRLVGPLRDATARVQRELDELPPRLEELRGHLRTAERLLEGPTRVLLLASNNAEMRAGMGMHLSAGVVTIAGGEFETSPFYPTGALTARTEGRAEVPAELTALYGRIWDIGREWRTTSTTPDFPTVGRIIGDLAERTPVGSVDAVVSLDVPALAMLLGTTGPVEVDGEVVSAGNAVTLLLRDNYLRLGEVSEADERRSLQSQVANAVFDSVTSRGVDVVDLATALTGAAEGRHLMGWSADPGVQALWESIGADGALTPDSFLVAAQNATASKRDVYLAPEVELVPLDPPGRPVPSGRRRYRATLELHNPVIRPSAPYVDSLNRYVPKGVHRAFVTFTLPGAARDLRVVAGKPAGIGTDGPTRVAAAWLRVPESETGSASVEFTLPAGARAVDLVPGARVLPTVHRFGPVSLTDAEPRRVALPRIAERGVQEPRPLVAAALIAAFAAVALLASRSRRLAGPDVDVEGAAVDAQLARAVGALTLLLAVLAALG